MQESYSSGIKYLGYCVSKTCLSDPKLVAPLLQVVSVGIRNALVLDDSSQRIFIKNRANRFTRGPSFDSLEEAISFYECKLPHYNPHNRYNALIVYPSEREQELKSALDGSPVEVNHLNDDFVHGILNQEDEPNENKPSKVELLTPSQIETLAAELARRWNVPFSRSGG